MTLTDKLEKKLKSGYTSSKRELLLVSRDQMSSTNYTAGESRDQ
jgi:hypothetical protein